MCERIQRKRTKGWRMPENTISVCRPGKYGNPFCVGSKGIPDRQAAVDAFRKFILKENPDLSELKGKNLACFCPLDEPCHADVLLELVN